MEIYEGKLALKMKKKVSAEWRDLPCGCMRRPNIIYSSKNSLYFQHNYKPLPYESLLVFNYKPSGENKEAINS